MTPQEIITALLEDKTNMFISAVLTPASQSLLKRRVPPVHSNVYAHHATIAFKPEAALLDSYLARQGECIRIPVTGIAIDDKAQAVLVGMESENDYPHITISTAEGVDPRYSNDLFTLTGLEHVSIFTLEGIITVEALL
jgi:hypothetical protein